MDTSMDMSMAVSMDISMDTSMDTSMDISMDIYIFHIFKTSWSRFSFHLRYNYNGGMGYKGRYG